MIIDGCSGEKVEVRTGRNYYGVWKMAKYEKRDASMNPEEASSEAK